MSEINFKEGWKTATLKCVMCRQSEEVEYDPARRKRHIQGEMVQMFWEKIRSSRLFT